MCKSLFSLKLCLYFVSVARQSEILVENCDFFVPLAFDVPVRRGPRRSIATKFGTEKLEWCGYPVVKKL